MKYAIFSMLLAASALLFAGCSQETSVEGGRGEGLHVNAPGVKVDVGGGKGVNVEAPGTDVHVGGGQGVQVDAPNTKVDVN